MIFNRFSLYLLVSFTSIIASAQTITIDTRRSELLLPTPWHLDKIGYSENIQKQSTFRKTIKVAIIDSGIDFNHPDLKDKIFTNYREIPNNGIDDDNNGYIDDVHGYNFADNNNLPQDDNGHGTHVSGIIGASNNPTTHTCGIIPNVKIIPLRFLNKQGSGDTQNAIKAIYYAIKMKADIINASWGSYELSNELQKAIEAANSAGIIFVTSSGNYQSNNDLKPIYPANYMLDNLISVAATDENDILDPFSNFGATTVSVAAPGSNIVSTYLNNGYEALSGTSMASPIVAGIAGLIKQNFPQSSPLQIKKLIMSSCETNSTLATQVICKGRVTIPFKN